MLGHSNCFTQVHSHSPLSSTRSPVGISPSGEHKQPLSSGPRSAYLKQQEGSMVVLTDKIIKGKTKLDLLEDVKNLNLWGQDIDDVAILANLPNVEVLSLSVNRIPSLRDFRHCHALRELYLRKNEIADINEVAHLVGLKQLKVLWLSDNPCADAPSYRQLVVRNLPVLEKLDNVDVTQAERDAAAGAPTLQPATSQELAALSLAERSSAADAAQRPAAGISSSGTTAPAPNGSQGLQEGPKDDSACRPRQVGGVLPQLTAVGMDITAHISPVAMQPRRSREAVVQAAVSQPAAAHVSRNVLYAVMALVAELEEGDLVIVQREVEQRLGQLRGLMR